MSRSIESRLAEVFRDYLAPSAPVPIRTMEEAMVADLQRPFILIRGAGYNPQTRRLSMTADLHSISTGSGATSPETCADYLGRVRARLADRAALYAHFATLPADQRIGWQLLHHSLGESETSLGEAENHRIDTQPFQLVLRVRDMVGAA